MSSPFHEVTSKIAFAIAKSESIATAALAILVVGLLLLVGEVTSPPQAAADVGVIAIAAVVLGFTLTRSNLEKVNRPSLRWLNAGGALKIAGMLVAWVSFRSDPSYFAADLGLVLAIAAVTVAYPLPIRRGSTVLYDPAAVRILADGRSRTLACGVIFALALPAAISLGLPVGGTAGLLPIRLAAAALAVTGAAGIALWSGLPPGIRRSRTISAPLAAAAVVGVAAIAASTGFGPLLVIGPAVGAAAMGLGVPGVLGARLTRDKTIVSRR